MGACHQWQALGWTLKIGISVCSFFTWRLDENLCIMASDHWQRTAWVEAWGVRPDSVSLERTSVAAGGKEAYWTWSGQEDTSPISSMGEYEGKRKTHSGWYLPRRGGLRWGLRVGGRLQNNWRYGNFADQSHRMAEDTRKGEGGRKEVPIRACRE